MFNIANRVARFHLPLLLVASALIAATPAALGDDDISYVTTFRNIDYHQTGNGNTLSLHGTFFSADIFSTAPNVYSSASVMFPDGSSTALSQNFPADYGFQTFLLPDQATMNAMFPTGMYTFTGVQGAQTDTATLNYNADDYTQSLPFLTGTNYDDLQGMNASQSFTFNVSPYVPGGTQKDALMFLTVFDSSGNVAFTQGFLPPSTTSITMNGGQLAAGTSYTYELDFSDRNIGTDLDGGAFPPQLGFDVRTDGAFTTAAAAATPEPSSLILLGTGLLAGIAAVRRRIA